jgi:galactokinase
MAVAVPGRVNLIGEHIDYHGLPVLPMAIGRTIRVKFRPRSDSRISAVSAPPYGPREFEWTRDLTQAAAGDWENYLRAAARVAETFLPGNGFTGIDAAISSDLPAAAGLSSSTALLVAFTLALLRANGREPSFEELMTVLPDGEQFVGTRGGGMDHAAVLGSREGCASLIGFDPVSLRPIPIPADWSFLVAHSLQTAEKSGGAREHYNAKRAAGTRALARLGLDSYRAATPAMAEDLGDATERASFLHVTTEAERVYEAACAMERSDADAFGRLLLASHASLRDRLEVSCAALDRLVDAGMESGALGARLTGAGFGGCAVIFCKRSERPAVRRRLMEQFYAGRAGFEEFRHLLDAEPSAGVLYAKKT